MVAASRARVGPYRRWFVNVSMSGTAPVYRHEIRPALTKGAVAMDKIFGKAPGSA